MSVGAIIGIVIVAILALVILFIRMLSKESTSFEEKNDAIRKEIMESGITAEATILEAESVGGKDFVGAGRTLVKVDFTIHLTETGEVYNFSRRRLSVPLNLVSDFRKGKTLPIMIHKNDRNLLLFDFDRNGSADHKMFED